MVELEERVETLETVLADFIRESSRVMAATQKQIAAISGEVAEIREHTALLREEVAEIRIANARTDRALLEMRKESDRKFELAAAELEELKKDNERKHAERKAEFERNLEEWKKDSDRKHAERKAEFERNLEEWKKDNERKHAERKVEFERNLKELKKDNERKHAERKVEFERQLAEEKKENDRKFEQAERERKDFNRRLAEATDSQGLMIENMVWPNLRRIAKQVFRGGEVVFSGIRLKRRLPSDRGRVMELDLLAVGENEVLVCEAKSKVDDSKVREFLDKLRDFPTFFPDYAGLTLRPMIASIYFEESVVNHMTNQNVIALAFGDETMEVLNPRAFSAPAA